MPVERIEWELCLLLADCLNKDGPKVEAERLSALTAEQSLDFLALAAEQRVSPLLWHRLKQKALDGALRSEAAEQLREAGRLNTMRNLHLCRELRRLISALEPEGIPLVLLKGIYLAEAVYGNVGLREMSDIDVLARTADLGRIVEVLAGMGYAPFHEGPTRTARHHLPPMVKNGHARFEIHWDLTPPDEDYSFDPREVWERTIPFTFAGCDALALSPEDLLLHLCWHTSYHHRFAFGLRPSCDIAETISRFGSTIDWHAVTERTMRRGWQRGVYLALLLAKEVTGAAVPSDALDGLRPAEKCDAVLAAARNQIFTERRFAVSIPEPFADLLKRGSLGEKVRVFLQRVFLSRGVLASMYAVPMDSVRIYGCYPRRLIDLLHRHYRTWRKYGKGDAPLKALVERTGLVACWLADQRQR